MEWRRWEPIYGEILRDFGFSRAKDAEVAELLARLLGGRRIGEDRLDGLLRGREVTVLGNGPNLGAEIASVAGTLLAADEATSMALAHGLRPAIITTDLDGRVEDQLKCNAEGTVVLVLGHGDNRAAVERWAPRFQGPTMAMTQGEPSQGLHNFGGFTDGDRAVFLAQHFGARRIRLLGFDFDHPSPKDAPGEMKLRKLRWARRLIEGLGSPGIILGAG